jgi:hypothetical protein
VNVLLASTLVAVASAIAVVVMLLIRRRAPEGGYFADGDRAAGVYGVLATSFSVLLAFVVFLAFTSYDDARSGSDQEATDVIQQLETAQLFPQPAGAQLSGELVCYGRAVVYQEWPQLRRGVSPRFNPWGVPLFRTLTTVDPKTPAQQAAYSKWLDQTSDREQARLSRIEGVEDVIPSPLWYILLLSAAIVLLYTFFFADSAERKSVQALFAGAVTALLVTSILVISFFDNPYQSGSGSLEPTSMKSTLARMSTARAALELHFPIPCDASGKPLAGSATG